MDEPTGTGTPSESGASASPATSGSAGPATSGSTMRWVVIVLVVVAIVLFIAWARRNPPFDDRVPDEDGIPVLIVNDVNDRGGL